MRYSISTRPLSDEERTSLRKSSRFSLDDWAWVVFWAPALGSTGYVFGRLVEWGFAKLTFVVTPFPSILCAVCGLVAGGYMCLCFYQGISARARAATIDLRSNFLHVISVQTDSVVQQKEFSDEGPIYFFDLGGERILLLWGQWLFGPHSSLEARTQRHDSDHNAEVNTREFPCTEFVLHRFPVLGRVSKLECGGSPLRPTRELEVHSTKICFEMSDCEILNGAFDDLPNGIHGKADDFSMLPIG